MKKPRPRVLLTTRSYRIVHTASGWTTVEIEGGSDRMGARRWKDPMPDETSALLQSVVDQIGDALITREKRRKARRV